MLPHVYSLLPDFSGSPVVIIGGGASLKIEDVAYAREKRAAGGCHVIAVNRGYWLAPWADLLHAGDAWFWLNHRKPTNWQNRTYPPAQDFAGPKCTIVPVNTKVPDHERIIVLPAAERHGKPFHDPTRPVHKGWDSQYQATQIAVVRGAKKIIQLGLDGGGRNWHDGYGQRHSTHWPLIVAAHRDLAVLLQIKDVEVWNMNPESKVDAYLFASRMDSVL